jgi:hypothetical protein
MTTIASIVLVIIGALITGAGGSFVVEGKQAEAGGCLAIGAGLCVFAVLLARFG